MKNRQLKVMQVIGNLDIGGGQEVVRTLVEYLAPYNCQSIVCSFKDGPLRDEIRRLDIPVEVITGRRYSVVAFPFFIVDQLRIGIDLAKLIKKYKVDIIQTHLLGSLDFLILVLRYTTPLRSVLWTFHNYKFELTANKLPRHRWMLKPKRIFYRLLYRVCSVLVDGFVAVSDQVKDAMIDVIGPIGNKITVIYNGVDIRRYGQPFDKMLIRNRLKLREDHYLISVVATLKEQKGHRYLIDALASIVMRHPEVRAIFIGDGPLRNDLELYVKNCSLDKHICFLGNRSDVAELLAASDIFVLPSLWEGLPMALLEAMATGLAVVASEVSGTVKVVIPNESGILVPPGDIYRLTQAIERLINNPSQVYLMGTRARHRVEERFSAKRQAHEHWILYNRTVY